MAKPLLPDALWARIEPLLPPSKPRRHRYPGRKPLTHRQALTGILFVLKFNIPWNELPAELCCGSGSRCRRRLQQWLQQGVWQRLHEVLLAELHGAGRIDRSRASADCAFCRALGGGRPRAVTPPTAASWAASTTSWWTPGASPWPPPRRSPTAPR